MFATIGKPEQETKNHYGAEYYHAVIHALRIWLHRRRPHGKERTKDGVSDCYHGDWNI